MNQQEIEDKFTRLDELRESQTKLIEELKVSKGLEFMWPGCFKLGKVKTKWHHRRTGRADSTTKVVWFLNIQAGKEVRTFEWEEVHPWVQKIVPTLDGGKA